MQELSAEKKCKSGARIRRTIDEHSEDVQEVGAENPRKRYTWIKRARAQKGEGVQKVSTNRMWYKR